MGTIKPYYRRSKPAPQNIADFASDNTHIDLTHAHMEPYDVTDPVNEANRRFDKRAAAAVSDTVGFFRKVRIFPSGHPEEELLEWKDYGLKAPAIFIPTAKCLAAMAYPDYFPAANADYLRHLVSKAILAASPGWCGTFGPGVTPLDLLGHFPSGDYDMSQMHLLPIAYRYYDELLSPEAREHLITHLLAQGRIHRVGLDDTLTHGGMPNDWSRAGIIDEIGLHIRSGETENHTLMILTARYLTNQLLYQRDHDPVHDNRRNSSEDAPTCTELMLYLLRNILRDDFSEYNAKPYQTETRTALLNLCSYAYDHEVRLAARMVLDYISAHIAVSSSDLRRMVPFRRRNEAEHNRAAQLPGGFMNVGLLEWFLGADPMAEHFAMQAGNTRAYETPNDTLVPPDNINKARPWGWAIASGGDAVMEALSDYRLPPSIHDLFVNDLHRRFFQRLHRVPQDDVEVTGRNCDNQEIYAGSPSYLITAGGEFATWAIDPGPVSLSGKVRRTNDQQLGVAVTTSFMPTLRMQADCGNPNQASDLIQFGRFTDVEGVYNYGVAPDFACGPQVYLPNWCQIAIAEDRATYPEGTFGDFKFVYRGSAGDGPGFYLAFLQKGDFTVMEAFDTWLHPRLAFQQFRINVYERNKDLMEQKIDKLWAGRYITENGLAISFLIFNEENSYGARVDYLTYTNEYGPPDSESYHEFAPKERLSPLPVGDQNPGRFLEGTVMNSKEGVEGVVEITNHFLETKITLDMSDQSHPKRITENLETKEIEVEVAGFNNEVWLDFEWKGPNQGDVCQPFNTLAAATAAVADGGVIKIVPGQTHERITIGGGKRMKLVAPIGGVTIGVR